MMKFHEYLDPSYSLEWRLEDAYLRLGIEKAQQDAIKAMMEPIRVKDFQTHRHMIRVGLLAMQIGQFMHLDQKALLYAGLLHDVGKAMTNPATLKRTDTWTKEDAEEMKAHVSDGYRMLRGYFDFSAEIIIWHHRFQQNGYPESLPVPLHEYSEGTKVMISFYGRILALSDVFDALHRVNSKYGALCGDEIRVKMYKFNPDQTKLLDELYSVGILTTKIYEEVAAAAV